MNQNLMKILVLLVVFTQTICLNASLQGYVRYEHNTIVLGLMFSIIFLFQILEERDIPKNPDFDAGKSQLRKILCFKNS